MYTLKIATDLDFEFIHGLRTEAYRAYVEQYYRPWDDREQRQHLAAAWDKRDRWVISVSGSDVGYLDAFWGDHLNIGNIIVHAGQRGRGLGTLILVDLIGQADERSLPCRLQVFRSNPAVALYQRLGFAIESESDTHLFMVRPVSPT